ncbi:hypothetical protein LOTGIDRAFT_138707 [Lottia gigantea]|uniref:DNA annealing helicase and endonuclease ZRANB3 n=1 Tax=Lottia gigantea TaxID=225164 RepID=V4B492_LOTGI|nr:hypothetical protein LOTGIDRAFT_138707 [Lottia gigantea]ESP02276.1 hypothetical protein LOTGIDRAFT_138707 [Lottia gigantea]
MKTHIESILEELPFKLRHKLMQFQKEGIEYAVNNNGRVLLADEMGLGKTIQAISIAYYYKEDWPLLIIVPSSLRYCWIEEIEKWLPDIHPHDINLIMMGNDAKNISTAKISIVTYGLLSKSTSHIVKEALTNQKFQVIICDESHYIKNNKTASSKAVVPLVQAAERRILLSGTPALAKPVELFPQLDALCPKAFGSWWDFTARYCDAKLEWFGRMKRRKVDGASNLEELQTKLVKMVMIRREKKDVLTQLPPKQRQKVLFELKDSELKKVGITLVDQGQITSDDKQDTTTLGLISKLLQLTGEAKVGPVKDYINMLIENENLKFLVFAYHHVMMNGIQQLLYEKKVKFIRIDGTVPPADRQMYVTQFQSDPSIKVAILSILAAGVGLTLTAAKLVVFAEMYWTPGVMVQCEDRAHRIGQTSCVPVHYLVAKGTMDEWVWSAVCKKTVVTSTTLSGKKQELEAESGDKYQVELLSNAEVNYAVEDENSDMDLSNYFQSQRPNDQKSILDFLTPPTSRNKSAVDTGKRKRNNSEEINLSSSKKPKTVNQDIVILDSDSENEDFLDSPFISSHSHSSPSNKSDQNGSMKLVKEAMTAPHQKNHWSCMACTYLNHQQLPYCEMCDTKTPVTPVDSNNRSGCSSRKPLFKQRRSSIEYQTSGDGENISQSVNSHHLSPAMTESQENKTSPIVNNKVLNISIPETVYKIFLYCGSRYTGRIYIFDENEEALNINFVPLDIELNNIDDLPDLLKYRPHLRLIQNFVREWNLLTETKRRLLINRGVLFINPVAAYQQISSKQTSSTQRHKTKEDISQAAAKLATSINGTVRQISKKPTEESNKTNDDSYGIAQVINPTFSKSAIPCKSKQAHFKASVVNNEGVPLCLNCSQPYSNSLLTTQTITSNNNAWQTRFCSLNCADSHWTKTDSGYCRDKIYQIEHGVCQICQFDAHSFYKQIKDTVDMKVRVKLISESKFSKLKSKVKEVMARKPVEGQFWHVDHIKPVFEGGGMCDIDNMRTLCVICHQKVTSQQASKRAQVRKLAGAAGSGDITAFFQKI